MPHETRTLRAIDATYRKFSERAKAALIFMSMGGPQAM